MKKKPLEALSWGLATLSVGVSSLLFYKVSPPAGGMKSFPKTLAGALAPWVALFGALSALLGWLLTAPWAFLTGGLGTLWAVRHVLRIISARADFDLAFGVGWERRVPPEHWRHMQKRRWRWRVSPPPAARLARDVVFGRVVSADGVERKLLCDIWQPPARIAPSGLALVYNHGGAWSRLDKDMGTRSFFSYLAAQGHVVMDVSYRLWPETDLRGMLGDVKRALVWIKRHAAEYGVDPRCVVVAGGSAGAHLALLAAYTAGNPHLTPVDLRGADASVAAVISYYGAVDMWATYAKVRGTPDIKNLLGGHPEAIPGEYSLASPLTYLSSDCPPTLLFQGEDDWYMPLESTLVLYRRLLTLGVPAACVTYPQTDHAFDFLFPRGSPVVQASRYDLERFLFLILAQEL